MDHVVVVGAGLAGARSCEELRNRGYDGRLTLIGAEHRPPYDRPPLSKAVLRAADIGAAERLAAAALETDLASLGVTLRLGERATALRPGVLTTERLSPGAPGVRVGPGSAESIETAYDGLVLAVGAVPIRLPGDGAVTLRTADDALALRRALRSGARVVIVGAGWIGAEVATAAIGHRAVVDVLEVADTPVPALGIAVGARLAARFAAAGVRLHTATRVIHADGDHVAVTARGVDVDVAAGGRIDADLVLCAIGVRPDVRWLAGSGLDLAGEPAGTGGILVDASLATSLPGVVAVGDCALRWSPRAGRRVRTEHWDDALHAPEVAAATLLGERATYDPVAYVWSEQFGGYVQCVGAFDGEPGLWREDGTTWAAGWLDADGRLGGLVSVDRPRDALQARKAIAAGGRLDPVRFTDPSVPLRASLL